jgi:HTH-type transcriptional regulator / antitoxin HigA
MNKVAIDHKTYKQLLAQFEPRPIESDDDNAKALDACERLMLKGEEITAEELALLKVISTLIREYEAQRYQIWSEDRSPREILLELLEANGLSQSDLGDIMPQPHISAFLAHKRGISKSQALALGQRFHINPTVFLWPEAK